MKPAHVFPPYGQYAASHAGLFAEDRFPLSWRPGESPEARVASWHAWRKDTLACLTDVLWPQWSHDEHTWISPNPDRMHALTEADFKLLKRIAAEPRILDQRPTPANAAAWIPPHRTFYTDEDEGRHGHRYNAYDTTLPEGLINAFRRTLDAAVDAKEGAASLYFKRMLQRPRPYQAAAIFGVEHYWEVAKTSLTPSMSSGHSLQGCMMAAGILEAWLDSGYTPTGAQVLSLAQFGMDLGDRRVFAGVHYPSDNLASWIIALRLAPEVLREPTRRFLYRAITEQSLVFSLIRSSGADVYGAALDVILRAGNGA